MKYLYIDDPISSLDDNNAIAVASHLAQLLKNGNDKIKTVISTHHHLFFNVICNELGKAVKYFVSKEAGRFLLTDTGDTPRYHHVALLKQLHEVATSGQIYTYHFNILRDFMDNYRFNPELFPAMDDDFRDAGDRATQEAKAEVSI